VKKTIVGANGKWNQLSSPLNLQVFNCNSTACDVWDEQVDADLYKVSLQKLKKGS
jgi:hypothetical protein